MKEFNTFNVNKTNFAKVKEFHEKFGRNYEGPPRLLSEEQTTFRANFMQEELDEFKDAFEQGDLTKAFDALLDLAYVVYGTAEWMGLPFDQGFEIVHQANMQKVGAVSSEESKRGSALDIIKPLGWTAPDQDLEDLLQLETSVHFMSGLIDDE